jgi:hypothetical protein
LLELDVVNTKLLRTTCRARAGLSFDLTSAALTFTSLWSLDILSETLFSVCNKKQGKTAFYPQNTAKWLNIHLLNQPLSQGYDT